MFNLKTIQITILLSLFLVSCKKENSTSPHVLLISIDGFRHDYAERYQATNLLEIASEGTQASSLIPCFPSKTFPNHYSIVTGMYPENHGIVDNYFYDPNLDDYFLANESDKVQNGDWYGGNPIWSLANQQGLKSATYFWIGSEAKINGSRPTYYKKYNPAVSGQEITTQILQWLQMPDNERPQLVAVYFSLVDVAGHDVSIDSPELKKAVLEIDNLIGELRNEIHKIDIPINLLLVSDHGMMNTNYENPIYYENLTIFC